MGSGVTQSDQFRIPYAASDSISEALMQTKAYILIETAVGKSRDVFRCAQGFARRRDCGRGDRAIRHHRNRRRQRPQRRRRSGNQPNPHDQRNSAYRHVSVCRRAVKTKDRRLGGAISPEAGIHTNGQSWTSNFPLKKRTFERRSATSSKRRSLRIGTVPRGWVGRRRTTGSLSSKCAKGWPKRAGSPWPGLRSTVAKTRPS